MSIFNGMAEKSELLNHFWVKLMLVLSAGGAFILSFFADVALQNFEQYLSISVVVLLDGFFGIIRAVKQKDFRTYKAVLVLKRLFAWIMILTAILSIEVAFSGTGWLSETLIMPFIVFQLLSILKNAALAGFINSDLVNQLLKNIDKHKEI